MNLFFDLDGTLTDSYPGVSNCIQYALGYLGRPPLTADELTECIGPPLQETFARLLGAADASLADLALSKYRERYTEVGIYEKKVYPGILDLLETLTRHGHCLLVATSKPTVYANRVVDHFGLAGYFQSINGSELNGVRTDKTSLIAHILGQQAVAPENAVMIGDRKHDMIGARNNGLPGVGVLWGYGAQEELVAAGAVACAATPHDLEQMIIAGDDLARF